MENTKAAGKRRYRQPFPLCITDERGNKVPNRMHEEMRKRKLTRADDFIISGFSTDCLPIEEDDVINILVEAHMDYSSFMDWSEMMLSEWKQRHPERRLRADVKGASFLSLQRRLRKYVGIDLLCFLCMFASGVEKWPEQIPSVMPVTAPDKYYILAIIDGFREKLGIRKYRLMQLLHLQPSDISFIELSYTKRAQRRQDITMYKLFQIMHVMHIPLMQFIEHLYRISRDDGNQCEMLDYYSSFLSV